MTSDAVWDSPEVWVVGGGVVGVATAATRCHYTEHRTVLVERDDRRREDLAAAIVQGRVSVLLDEALSLSSERVRVVGDLRDLPPTATVVVAVGTEGETGMLDTTGLRELVSQVASPSRLVVIRSTIDLDTLAHLRALGGRIAVAPEFLVEGAARLDVTGPDRVVVGADDQMALEQAVDACGRRTLRDGVLVVTPEEAVLIKLGSNYMLHQRVVFAARMASLAERTPRVDAERVLWGISLDRRIGAGALRMGLGPGGSCLNKDTIALEAALADQRQLPDFAVRRRVHDLANLIEQVRGESLVDLGPVIVWGLGFKPSSGSRRGSPAVELVRELAHRGLPLEVVDPHRRVPLPLAVRGGVLPVQWAGDRSYVVDRGPRLVVLLTLSAFEKIEPTLSCPGTVLVDPYRLDEPRLRGLEGIRYVPGGVMPVVR